jgi:hypothetical protein
MTALDAAGPIRHRRAMRLTIADIDGGRRRCRKSTVRYTWWLKITGGTSSARTNC